MVTEVFADQAFTTVLSGGNTAGTSGTVEMWTVSAVGSFPGAQTGISQFHVCDTAPNASTEIVAVTNTAGTPATTWTVTRGAEGTTPVPHNPGFTVTQVITAGFLNTLASEAVPPATAGGMLYGNATPAPVWLAGNTTNTKEFLTSTGAGGGANAPQWGTITAADVPVLNQNTTGTSSNVTGTVAIVNGGTGGTSATIAYNALSPMTTTGDVEYESANNVASRLPGNTTSTKNFLTSTGSGGTATAPAWGTIASGDVPVLNQNTTGTSSNVTGIVAVVNGGTGGTAATAYAVVTGGTAATTPFQTVAALGTTGYVLTSNGAGQLPQWQANTGGSLSIPVTVVQGGSGGTAVTAYTIVTGGTSSTAPFQHVATTGTAGQALTSNGAGALPSFQAAPVNWVNARTVGGATGNGSTDDSAAVAAAIAAAGSRADCLPASRDVPF